MIKRVPFVAPAAGGGLEYDPIENSADNRAAYRHLLFSTPNLSDHVSGVILHEETLFQQSPELYEGQQQNFVSMLNSRGIVRMGKAFGQGERPGEVAILPWMFRVCVVRCCMYI